HDAPRRRLEMFQLTDDQRAIQEMARDFAQREVAPLSPEYQKRRRLPPGIVRRMGEQGLIGIMFPEEYGGAGGDVTAQALAVQEISKVNAGIGATLLVQVLALYPIWKVGSEELKRKYLPRGIRGEIIGAIGMTEPDAGSDFAAIRTRAVLDGEHYVVNGRKTFITNGPVADFVTLAVKTAPELGRRGISLLVVDKETPGFQVARKLDKMGWHTSETAELAFVDCRVPRSQLVGEENRGFYYVMEDFNLERIFLAAQCVGIAEAAFAAARDYACSRRLGNTRADGGSSAGLSLSFRQSATPWSTCTCCWSRRGCCSCRPVRATAAPAARWRRPWPSWRRRRWSPKSPPWRCRSSAATGTSPTIRWNDISVTRGCIPSAGALRKSKRKSSPAAWGWRRPTDAPRAAENGGRERRRARRRRASVTEPVGRRWNAGGRPVHFLWHHRARGARGQPLRRPARARVAAPQSSSPPPV